MSETTGLPTNIKAGQTLPSPNRHLRARWTLTILSIAVAAAALFFALCDKLSSQTSFEATTYLEAKKAAIDIRVDDSKSYFEMTLATLGALWALIAAQRNETRIRLSDTPEILMLFAACAVLLLSLFWHFLYLETVSAAYSLAVDPSQLPNAPPDIKGIKMPNVLQPAIDGMLRSQSWFFVSGVLLAVFTLISAHNLKDETK